MLLDFIKAVTKTPLDPVASTRLVSLKTHNLRVLTVVDIS